MDELGDILNSGLSKGVCRECGCIVDACYVPKDGAVYLERRCPEHGVNRALVAENLDWYYDAVKLPAMPHSPRWRIPGGEGLCPRSCGPCSRHLQACHLPVFSVTNACNLRCPICFTFNRNDKIYFMSPEEFDRHIDFVIDATGGVDLVNITGGEPTLHPNIFELLQKAMRPEIGRVTMNTNGLVIADNPDFAKKLADLGVYVILSLDTLKGATSQIIHGRDISQQKIKALTNLSRFGVQTTLLMVLIRDVNEDELGTLLDLTFSHGFVRSLTIQTMTYTGQGGGKFSPRRHIPVDGVERRIEGAGRGRIHMRDFLPLPSAHPLCYGVCYLVKDEVGDYFPLTDVLDRRIISKFLADGYLLRPTGDFEDEIALAINRLWSEGGSPALLRSLKKLVQTVYPADRVVSLHERQRIAEKLVKSIYIHAHVDEDTFELERAMRCPDQVPVHAERMIGACSYNLFYRMHDERFWKEIDK